MATTTTTINEIADELDHLIWVGRIEAQLEVRSISDQLDELIGA